MTKQLKEIINYLFYSLFFAVPLILWPYTSELFEFNKMIFTYGITIGIVLFWIIRQIKTQKIIFRRTILDIPLLLFLASQLLSTFTSIDFRTSLLGYYSRFNGGFLSTLSYSLLYWAFVSNLGKSQVEKAVRFLFYSAIFVSIYGVFQHFGIDANLWVQDVKLRVFSTLGQPNWLATFLVALLPLSASFMLRKKGKERKIFLTIFALFFLTLLYTKSRSGIFASFFGLALFSGGYLYNKKLTVASFVLKFRDLFLTLVLICLLIGTPWTPSVFSLLREKPAPVTDKVSGPALEVGGTESGKIRQIVWKGAVNIWKNHPFLGTGVETFGFSYYNFRPVEHNLVSEWDFLYNKAHNEYLNIAATTGTIGLFGYLYLIYVSLSLLFNLSRKEKNSFYLALFSGYTGILVANFFGFSVVINSLLFFLFPGFAIAYKENSYKAKKLPINVSLQKTFIWLTTILAIVLIYLLGRYWYADLLFAKGKLLRNMGNPVLSREYLIKATNLSRKESIFWENLSLVTADIATALQEQGESEKAIEFAVQATKESDISISLSEANVNLLRSRASIFIKLSSLDPNYLISAEKTLNDAIEIAPTTAKFHYNLGLTLARIGKFDEAVAILRKTVEMKENYREARLALAILLSEKGEKEEARSHLIYILENINPDDPLVKQELEEI